MGDPQISDVFPSIAPATPGDPGSSFEISLPVPISDTFPSLPAPLQLPPTGYVEGPNGDIVDLGTGETLVNGSPEWLRVVQYAKEYAPRDASSSNALKPVSAPQLAPFLYAQPLALITPLDDPATSDKTKTLVVLAAIVAFVLYSTRRK